MLQGTLPISRVLPSSQLPSPFCHGSRHIPQVPEMKTQWTSFRGHYSVYLTTPVVEKQTQGSRRFQGKGLTLQSRSSVFPALHSRAAPRRRSPVYSPPGGYGWLVGGEWGQRTGRQGSWATSWAGHPLPGLCFPEALQPAGLPLLLGHLLPAPGSRGPAPHGHSVIPWVKKGPGAAAASPLA